MRSEGIARCELITVGSLSSLSESIFFATFQNKHLSLNYFESHKTLARFFPEWAVKVVNALFEQNICGNLWRAGQLGPFGSFRNPDAKTLVHNVPPHILDKRAGHAAKPSIECYDNRDADESS